MPKRINQGNNNSNMNNSKIAGICQVTSGEDSQKSNTREKDGEKQEEAMDDTLKGKNGGQDKRFKANFWKKKEEENFGEGKFEEPPNSQEERIAKRKCSNSITSAKKTRKKPKGKKEEEKRRKDEGEKEEKKGRKDEVKSNTYVPPKRDDLGTFSFYCCIGNILQCDALADLGSCTNILPLSMYKRGRLGELKPANTILRLADYIAKYPEGMVKNVLVRVGNMTFLTDFTILDTTEDVTLPIIFGRPFLTTTNAIIDVARDEMELSDGQTKKKTFYAAKINHQAPTPPIPKFVLEYVRRKKSEYEEELNKEEEEEARRTKKKME